MSDDQAEHPQSDKAQRKVLLQKWVNDAATEAAFALQLVQDCRKAKSELEAIQPSLVHYRHRMRMWRTKATAVGELESMVSHVSDALFQQQTEWGTLPLTKGDVLVMQNDLALLRQSRSEMMAELASLNSDLTNRQQTLIGHLANSLAWVSIALGVLSILLAALSVVIAFVR